jgi:putative membrane protein
VRHSRYLIILGALFAILFVALAINPVDRADWVLENALVGGFLLASILIHRHFSFSRLSATLIFLFLCLHEIGSHYTYSLVPYDSWFQALTGTSFNELVGWERNNYDRVVHFAYGLLLAYPMREIFLRVVNVKGFWGYFLPLDVMMSTSMLYELIEWAAAAIVGGDLGMAYLGTQGDVWDAHKDMALASAGALIAMLVTVLVNAFLQRDFASEWAESFRVHSARPVGETAFFSMWRSRQRTD